MWQSIQEKYENANDINEFFNSLTEDEYVEYLSEESPVIDDTGRKDISVKVGTQSLQKQDDF